jgi:hypothetical protein
MCGLFEKYTQIWKHVMKMEHFSMKATIYLKIPPPFPPETMFVQVKWIGNLCHLNTNIV